MKTNPTKFAIICVKKRQKAGFLRPRSSKITVTKEKERRKRKSEEIRKGGEGKKSIGCTLSFYMQWNPVNTDTKGACYSVRIIRVSVLSGLSEKRQEHMFYRYKD